jgi:Large ribosomal RNA subunit accumulation protein YceD
MTRPAKRSWSIVVAAADVPETGHRFELAADPETRAAIAELAGLRALPRFEATFDVTRHGRAGLHVVGRVSATVEQTCVVTLEPIENVVEEAIDLIYAPGRPPATPADGGSDSAGLAPADGPEPLVDGQVDLGAIATEFLILGINPYPRKQGAIFEAPPVADDGAHPFASLAALKRGKADDGR